MNFTPEPRLCRQTTPVRGPGVGHHWYKALMFAKHKHITLVMLIAFCYWSRRLRNEDKKAVQNMEGVTGRFL